jgi:protein SCO1/2
VTGTVPPPRSGRRRWSTVARYAVAAAVVAVVAVHCGRPDGSGAGAQGVRVVVSPTPAGPYRGLQLDPAQPRPAFTLTDTDGRRYDFAARTRGRPTFLYFGYTHCPDVCPTTMADVAAALRSVPDRLRQAAQVVFVTTDPKRDTGAVLARWLRQFDGDLPNRFVGLTGRPSELVAAQVAARVPVASDEGQTHSAEVLLYGTDDYARVVYLEGSTPEDMQHDLPAAAPGGPAPR